MHPISTFRLTARRSVCCRVIVGQFYVEVGFDIYLGHAVAQVFGAHDGGIDHIAETIEDADAVVGGLHGRTLLSKQHGILTYPVWRRDRFLQMNH
jgi:hypothetical protein